MTLGDYELALIKIAEDAFLSTNDPSHDHLHIKRVVQIAKLLAQDENAELWIVIPAAYLHDIVSLPKNHPERLLASKYAAEKNDIGSGVGLSISKTLIVAAGGSLELSPKKQQLNGASFTIKLPLSTTPPSIDCIETTVTPEDLADKNLYSRNKQSLTKS